MSAAGGPSGIQRQRSHPVQLDPAAGTARIGGQKGCVCWRKECLRSPPGL
jgi:hypothetical protein